MELAMMVLFMEKPECYDKMNLDKIKIIIGMKGPI